MTQPRRARGKAALFSQDPAPDAAAEQDDAPSPAGGGLRRGTSSTGRDGIYSARRAGTAGRSFTVACRSCRAETPVTATDLARRVFRFGSLWWPLGRYPNRIPCPACGDTTWCQVRWRNPRPNH